MSRIEAPREETNRSRVIRYLEGLVGPLPPPGGTKIPINPIIACEVGLSLPAVRSSVGYLISLGLLKFTPEQSRQRLSASKSYNPKLEEEWGWISEYAGLMAPREIHEALVMERGVEIPLHALRQRIYMQIKRGKFDRKDEGYENSIHKTVLHATDEEIKGRVRLWLDVKRVLVEQEKPLPTTRIEWMSLLAEAVQSFGEVKAILEKEESGNLHSIPRTLYEWRLLARLLEARRIIQQTGIKLSESTEFNGLTKEVDSLSAERSEALKSSFAAIIKETPFQNGRIEIS